MRFSSVLLPDPDGPTTAQNSPRCSSRSMPCSTSVSTGVPMLNDLRTSRSETTTGSATDRHHGIEARSAQRRRDGGRQPGERGEHERGEDRKSTRLNSSHVKISYAVFCLKKKN